MFDLDVVAKWGLRKGTADPYESLRGHLDNGHVGCAHVCAHLPVNSVDLLLGAFRSETFDKWLGRNNAREQVNRNSFSKWVLVSFFTQNGSVRFQTASDRGAHYARWKVSVFLASFGRGQRHPVWPITASLRRVGSDGSEYTRLLAPSHPNQSAVRHRWIAPMPDPLHVNAIIVPRQAIYIVKGDLVRGRGAREVSAPSEFVCIQDVAETQISRGNKVIKHTPGASFRWSVFDICTVLRRIRQMISLSGTRPRRQEKELMNIDFMKRLRAFHYSASELLKRRHAAAVDRGVGSASALIDAHWGVYSDHTRSYVACLIWQHLWGKSTSYWCRVSASSIWCFRNGATVVSLILLVHAAFTPQNGPFIAISRWNQLTGLHVMEKNNPFGLCRSFSLSFWPPALPKAPPQDILWPRLVTFATLRCVLTPEWRKTWMLLYSFTAMLIHGFIFVTIIRFHLFFRFVQVCSFWVKWKTIWPTSSCLSLSSFVTNMSTLFRHPPSSYLNIFMFDK